jgi:hypothetical protein
MYLPINNKLRNESHWAHTSWKLIVTQLIKKLPIFYGNWRFITMHYFCICHSTLRSKHRLPKIIHKSQVLIHRVVHIRVRQTAGHLTVKRLSSRSSSSKKLVFVSLINFQNVTNLNFSSNFDLFWIYSIFFISLFFFFSHHLLTSILSFTIVFPFLLCCYP